MRISRREIEKYIAHRKNIVNVKSLKVQFTQFKMSQFSLWVRIKRCGTKVKLHK